jgi:DNA-binding NarL/FixJ family response regulator
MPLIELSATIAGDLERRVPRLTVRERQVLCCLLNGQSMPDAAEALGLSRRTVEVHIKNARKRLGYSLSVIAAHIAVMEARGSWLQGGA